MVQRRPITSHPAFAPLLTLWFAALLGLGVAVLPASLRDRTLASIGLDALALPGSTGRIGASAMAALLGAFLGLGLAQALARRWRRDPRPTYPEAEPDVAEHIPDEPARRPLRVREEVEDLADDMAFVGEANGVRPELPEPAATARSAGALPGDEGFMILTPQPVHPPRPAPDLQSLLEQFDSAIAGFRDGGDVLAEPASAPARSDPVRAFVARQTGTPAPSPLGGLSPDHQAELRAALDKLAQAHREQ